MFEWEHEEVVLSQRSRQIDVEAKGVLMGYRFKVLRLTRRVGVGRATRSRLELRSAFFRFKRLRHHFCHGTGTAIPRLFVRSMLRCFHFPETLSSLFSHSHRVLL